MNSRILIYSMLMIVISIIVSNLIYRHINSQIQFESISEVNKQTMVYVKSNIENVIDSVNSYSKLIISNEDVQSALDEDKDKLLRRQALLLQLNNYMETTPFISDIYLSDLEGNLYVAYKDKSINPQYLNSKVVEQAIRDNGSYSLHVNGGDYFDSYGESSFVSFVRAVKDINTQQIMGVLVINIPTSSLLSNQEAPHNNLIRDLYIVSNEESIVHTGMLQDELYRYKPDLKRVNNDIIKKVVYEKQEFLVSSLWMEAPDWHVVSVISLNQSNKVTDNYKLATLIMIMINLAFIFFGVALFSSLFVRPMKVMIAKIRRNGEKLELINLNTNIFELSQLEQEYNEMIHKIKMLIKNKVDEQKSLRKKELELLQAQIKPHFLYNTLDTIKLLSKKGENEMAFQAVKALGKFYRTSLGKGEEAIRIAEEFEIITNYMKIQRFRYKGIFELQTYLETSISEYKILRLILQPLVENALYHGIKPKGESGIIFVRAYKEDGQIKLIVEDDGVGFDVDILSDEENENVPKLNGYGVNNTIERLRIYYDNEVNFAIESQRGIGTKITISIPESVIIKQNSLGEYDE